jgi:pyroglutamyl-peptidase
MTTLVTGFEPFGGLKANASELVVRALATWAEPGVITAVLPTSYRRAEARIGDLLHAHQPRTVLLLGLDQNTPRIRIEQVALNLDDSHAPDNDGEVRLRRRIIEEAPVGYRSSLPLESLAEVARDLGEDVDFSHDAGAYVCNHVYFTATHLVATELPRTRCGLVHLPALRGPGSRLTSLLKIVRIWIAASAVDVGA